MKLASVVLAAGLGKRMNSPLPKVLHTIHGIPMLQYILNALYEMKPQKIIVIVGKHLNEIRESIKKEGSITFAYQEEAKGTGDALLKAWPALKGLKGTVLVINGDTPLIIRETLKKLLTLHRKRGNVISLLSFIAQDPASYGRIIRDEKGRVSSIVEDRDATDIQRDIKEVNSGIYALESGAFHILKEIKLNESKGEYYLTDLISIARDKGMKADAFCIGSESELMGVNTQEELERASKSMKNRMIKRWMARGVNFIDTVSVFISPETKIGKGTLIYPNVYLEGATWVGRKCTIYPNVRIQDSIIGDEAVIKDSTLIECSIVKNKASVGPFARVRPGSTIGQGARIGNFVEVKKSVIGSGTKAGHLSYLGDSKIGNNVNVGAGTITCNYDGYRKHITVIEDNVFIGSDSQLIAPVRVGRGAYIGAGSTITKDVPSMSLAVSRIQQSNIKDWVRKRQLKVKNEKLKVKGAKSKEQRAKSTK
jgi:bifunctional UDP-N-acetylglucosamine pyrophosphorylase/glucosamine-1-phosphate N-acetyltransferase